MSEIIPMATFDGAAFQGGALLEMVEKFAQKSMAQSRANVADSTLKNRSLTKELVNEMIRTIASSADRSIANSQQQRLLTSLSSKFSLISSMQRNLG